MLQVMEKVTTEGRTERVKGRWLGLAALSLSGLVLGLDITVLVTALPTLSAKLGATTDQLQWMSAAYTLSLAGFMLPAGVLGDRFGRRKLLLIALVFFGISSVAASQVTTANGLIAMRAVMGISGAVILPLMQAMLPSMFAPDERQRAIGFAGVGAFLGLPLGPLVAGFLLTHYAWGSIFLINGPVVVLAVIGAWFFVPESKDPNPRRLDWFGAVLEVLGVTAIVYGIIEQPVHGWGDVQVYAPLIGGFALVAAFVAWELRIAFPLVDLKLFNSARFSWATVAFIVVGFAMTGVMFIISPFLQVVQGNDAQSTGARLLPLVVTMMAGALASDWLNKRLGTKVMTSMGLAGGALSMLMLSRVTADSGYGPVAAALAVMGASIAMAMIPALDAILGSLPEGETGGGSALTRTLQNVGGSLGVAIMGSVLNSAYQADLNEKLAGLPAAVRNAADANVAVAAAIAHHLPGPLAAQVLRSAQEAYVSGMSEVLVVTAGMMVVGSVLMAIFMPARPGVEAPAGERRSELAS
ncbi:MAG TPA: DHA2 family efflux MFS transporter permease subunit [Candidatus Dormibacteraeota bacterium]|nr:DHA2 family efflux MFS transporter permease subunit [Candidatus Dormibacteraeota bacterium]